MAVERKSRSSSQDFRLRSNVLPYLHKLRSSRPALFSEATMMDMFLLRRSMRRGAIVATTGRVDGPVIDLINRWRKKEKAKGTQPSLNMHQTYSTVRAMYPTMKAYSKAI